MIDQTSARSFAEDWIAAWNNRDLDRVLAHYSEDVEFSSPLIVAVAGEPSGKLKGNPAVCAYWEQCLTILPVLQLELENVLTGVDTITLYYRGPRGMAAETFFFGLEGKVCKAVACYA